MSEIRIPRVGPGATPGEALPGPVTVAGVLCRDYPAVVAALQAEIDRERGTRLRIAGERDEARSDYGRLRAALLEGGQSDAAVRRRCLAIIATAGTLPAAQPAPGLAAATAKLTAVARLTEDMHQQAQLIAPASNGPDDMPDMPDQIRAEVLHEYAARIRQLLGPEIVSAALEGQ